MIAILRPLLWRPRFGPGSMGEHVTGGAYRAAPTPLPAIAMAATGSVVPGTRRPQAWEMFRVCNLPPLAMGERQEPKASARSASIRILGPLVARTVVFDGHSRTPRV